MINPTQNQLLEFLENCTVKYDRYDYDNDVAYLYDEMGGDVAIMDFDTNQDIVQDAIWIDEEEFLLTTPQVEQIKTFLYKSVSQKFQDKSDAKKEKYEIPYHYLNS